MLGAKISPSIFKLLFVSDFCHIREKSTRPVLAFPPEPGSWRINPLKSLSHLFIKPFLVSPKVGSKSSKLISSKEQLDPVPASLPPYPLMPPQATLLHTHPPLRFPFSYLSPTEAPDHASNPSSGSPLPRSPFFTQSLCVLSVNIDAYS